MYKNRNYWLDIAKGIAIILMVIGHTPIPEKISHFIFAFHMPLFFIASGWSSNYIKYPFRQYVGKKWKSLMVPFFCYSLVVILLMLSIGRIDISNLLAHGWGGVRFMVCACIVLGIHRCSRCILRKQHVDQGNYYAWIINDWILSPHFRGITAMATVNYTLRFFPDHAGS